MSGIQILRSLCVWVLDVHDQDESDCLNYADEHQGQKHCLFECRSAETIPWLCTVYACTSPMTDRSRQTLLCWLVWVHLILPTEETRHLVPKTWVKVCHDLPLEKLHDCSRDHKLKGYLKHKGYLQKGLFIVGRVIQKLTCMGDRVDQCHYPDYSNITFNLYKWLT